MDEFMDWLYVYVAEPLPLEDDYWARAQEAEHSFAALCSPLSPEQQAQLEELQSGMLSAFSLEGEAIFRRSLELGLRLGAGGQAATPSAAGSRRR